MIVKKFPKNGLFVLRLKRKYTSNKKQFKEINSYVGRNDNWLKNNGDKMIISESINKAHHSTQVL